MPATRAASPDRPWPARLAPPMPSSLTATLSRSPDRVTVTSGLTGSFTLNDGSGDSTAARLSGLADRIAGVDGTLSVESPPGGPTIISAVLPCG